MTSFISVFFSLLFLSLLLPISPLDVSIEEKFRLGSTPPSCHSKCNGCHPCMAVQTPTLPRQGGIGSGLSKLHYLVYDSTAPSANKYTNYKPLGWKCHCRDHFYNP